MYPERLTMSGSALCYQHAPTLTTTTLLEKGQVMALLSLPIIPAPVEYRNIEGFPGYRVGDDGSVWSCWRRVGFGDGGGSKVVLSESWKKLTPSAASNGYLILHLYGVNGRAKPCSVHRLVLEAFVGPCPKGMECRHFPDGDRRNNRLENLTWGTRKSNHADKIPQGTWQGGSRNGSAKLSEDQVREIKRRLLAGQEQAEISRIFRVSTSCIHAISKGKKWKHITV